jgi:membrane-associated phospholipid phosphatase
VLFATDRQTAGELAEPGDHHSRLKLSADISKGGAFYTTTGIAGAFYLVGRASHNKRARETGILGFEALIDSGIVTSAIKLASQRPRPTVDDASGEFFDKGSSFPSGHAASVWSLATVIAHEYGRHRPLVQIAAYGAATAVSLARFTGQNHFLSDVLIGSAIGYGIGRYVYRTNHDRTLDNQGATSKPAGTHSRLIPAAFPGYSRSARAYGVRLAWTF